MPRDLRDPQKLGEKLEALSEMGASYSQVYEIHKDGIMLHIPDYDHGESLVTDTVRQYRLELKRAAEAGDKHAADTLRGIPNDDPSGD